MDKWQDPETIALWFGIVILFVLTLVVSIVLLVRLNYKKIMERSKEEARVKIEHQRHLLESSITIQEKERDRIAADLHDSLIGKLTAVRLKNQMNLATEDIDKMIHDSIIEARRITHDLSPPLIEHTSLEEIIREKMAAWEATFKLNYKFDIRTDFGLTPRSKVQLTRILQEVITNISKHAEASVICLHLKVTKRFLVLYISDNGKGFDIKKIKRGLGLRSIESRVQYINAMCKLRSVPNKSTSFLFLLKRSDR